MMLESLEGRRLWSAGDLDLAFGTNGKAGFQQGISSGFAVLQNDKVLVLTEGDNDNEIGVTRYNANGSVDTSFDGDGRISFAFDDSNTSTDSAAIILALPTGGFLIGGDVAEDILDPFGEQIGISHDPWLAKFDADGSLDESFGNDGRLAFTNGFSAHNAALQADNKIVIAAGNGVIRLNANGTRDNTFASSGFAPLPNALTGTFVNVIEVQDDGGIVAGGGTEGVSSAVLYRFNSNGTADNSFGDQSKSVIPLSGTGRREVAAIEETAGGKLVVGIRDYVGTSAVARLTADGALDLTFSGDGISAVGFGPDGVARTQDVRIDGDGKILLLMNNGDGGYSEFFLDRLNADGTLDSTFGRVFGGDSTLYRLPSIALQSDGGVVLRAIAGASQTPGGQLMRFQPDGVDPSPIRITSQMLIIEGSNDDDVIFAGKSAGSEISATINAIGRRFQASGIVQANITSGDGDDYIDLDELNIVASVTGGDGNDRIGGTDADDTLNGGLGRDRVGGGAGNDVIDGGADRDKLNGSFGNDTLRGGSSGDWLQGGEGGDSLVGQGGDDFLYAGPGDATDILLGNAGNDTFFAAFGGFDSIFGGSGRDVAAIDEDDSLASIEELLTD